MIHILHSADIHLDSPLRSMALRDPELRDRVEAATRGAFLRLVQTALDTPVAALLIAGDLFDGAARSAKTAAFLITELDRLRAAGIAVFYTKGNHDAENPVTGEITLPDNVHVFDGRGGKVQLDGQDIWIHGVSFAQKHAPDSLLGKFSAPVPGAINIAMLHTSLSGASGHDPYAPCSIGDLQAMGFDYWALGHVHKRQVHSQDPWVVMPGMPQGRDIGEDGPKSASLIRISDGRIEIDEVPTAEVVFARLDIDVSAITDEDGLRADLRAQFRAAYQTQAGHSALILRVRLTGQTPLAWRLIRDEYTWRGISETLARDAGDIWIEKLSLDVRPAASPKTGASANDELAQIIENIAQEPGFAAWRDAEIETLLSDAAFPRDRRAALLPDEEALAPLGRDLVKRGTARMLARLKGAQD